MTMPAVNSSSPMSCPTDPHGPFHDAKGGGELWIAERVLNLHEGTEEAYEPTEPGQRGRGFYPTGRTIVTMTTASLQRYQVTEPIATVRKMLGWDKAAPTRQRSRKTNEPKGD